MLNQDKIAATLISFNTQFNAAFGQMMDSADMAAWMSLATKIASTTKVEQHNWLSTVPAFKEWTDRREIKKLGNYSFQVTNKKWANGLEVDQDDIDDDRLGLYAPKIQDLAREAAIHRVNLLVDFLIKGFATTTYGAAYDGLAFFSASHKDGDGPTQSNLLTASLDDSGAYDSAVKAMMLLQNENGEPAGFRPTHLLCGPKNRATANQLLKASHLASGASNTNFNDTQLLISPKISGTLTEDMWFLLDLSRSVKPLLLQTRREVAFRQVGTMQQSGMNSMEQFMTDKTYFGCDARYNAAYGLWQACIGSNGTA